MSTASTAHLYMYAHMQQEYAACLVLQPAFCAAIAACRWYASAPGVSGKQHTALKKPGGRMTQCAGVHVYVAGHQLLSFGMGCICCM